MLESLTSNELQYEKLTPEQMSSRGILGRLSGVIADYKQPTRNGRLYSEALWDRVFDDPIMKEKIANRLCFGELGHPFEERNEVDMEKIAICLADYPKKDKKNGKLMGIFDILDTPNGRILKTLCDYGSAIGVSSRGQGDTYTDFDGQEKVDESTYDCTGFDAVLIPAVKSARPKFVTESYQGKSLSQALTESLNSATEEDRKIMQETLNDLGIDVNDSSDPEPQTQPTQVDNINATIELESAENNGESLVEELQTALLEVQKLQSKVGNLQEKLSVCYAKEYDYEDKIDNYKKTIFKLTESNKTINPLKKRVESLTEELDGKNKTLIDSSNAITGRDAKLKAMSKEVTLLKENLSDSRNLVESLKKQLETIQKQSSDSNKQLQKQVDSLTEQLVDAKKDSTIKHKNYTDKLEKANQLVEKYKKIAKTSVDKYIGSQALKLGVSSTEIKSKLNESYTFNDIDRVCDEIQEYRIGLNSLPFRQGFQPGSKMRINESIDTTLPLNEDDTVDDTLLSIVGLN